MRLHKTLVAVALLTALILGLSAPVARAATQDVEYLNQTGVLKEIGGARGKVVLVTFMATWCLPCRVEMKHLNALREEFGPDELVILGLSVDADPGPLPEFLRDNKVAFPVYVVREDVSRHFQVRAIPKLLVYDRKGTLKESLEGLMDEDELRDLVKELLDK